MTNLTSEPEDRDDADGVDTKTPAAHDTPRPARLPFPVVGIGASAGGLEAYSAFLQAMPADSGMAFVLVQHLPPEHESLLAELLSKQTDMPVRDIEDGVAVEANHVYIIRPGKTLTLRDGHLHLGEVLERRGHSRPVDDFFRSLAEQQRERAIALVMSGMGSNGTAGAQQVKAVGGVCIAQDPESAKFPSMPQSLIESGAADFVLRPDEIPEVLKRYAGHPYLAEDVDPKDVARREQRALTEIMAVLRTHTRHDFSGYKKPTLVRRIQRRMSLGHHQEMAAYAQALRHNKSEVSALADDLLIHVTAFFRDVEAWDTLRERVIDPLVATRESDGAIRAWITACSSGEEAYTLGILLLEAAERVGKDFDIKIFATDTADRQLVHARAGVYPGGIESEVSPERLARFFEPDGNDYRVKKELRDLVIFAPQNILRDPPFSRLDIATCRNLLIYLEPEVQQRVLALLHFGLRSGGALLLGSSETTGTADAMFEPIDKKCRLFRRVGTTRHDQLDFPASSAAAATPSGESVSPRAARVGIAQLTHHALLERFTPPAVVVDRAGQVLYYHGDTGRFLDQPTGEPTRDLIKLAREHVRGAVREAMHRAAIQNTAVSVEDGLIENADGRRRIVVHCGPLEHASEPGHFLVTFAERLELPTNDRTLPPDTDELREELGRVRDELQSTIEELQSTNEEMKASNEEITSINEELQSTNEELETSKEELQSLNEELTTVNAQLQSKMQELERTSNDLASLLSSTDIAVIFLDRKFHIRRYTPAMRELMELIPTDAGRPLSSLARKFDDPDLLDDAAVVLDKLVPIERQIVSDNARIYARRVLPYRTGDDRIDGVVVTFVDITDRTRAEEKIRLSEQRTRIAVETAGMGFCDWEIGTDNVRWEPQFNRLFGLPADQIDGTIDLTLSQVHPDDRAHVEEVLRHSSKSGKDFAMEFRVIHSDKSIHWLATTGRPTATEAGRPRHLIVGVLDITDRKDAEGDRLRLLDVERESRKQAEIANEAKDDFLANVSHELRTPLSAILLWAKMLLQFDKDDLAIKSGDFREAADAIERSARAQKSLIDDLLDVTRIAAGQLRVEPRPADLAEWVEDALKSFVPIADDKQITIMTDIGDNVGELQIDPERMQQVLWNLLSNAVKFSPEGSVVQVGLWRRDDEVELRITDEGIGIDPALLPLLFQRFSQIPAAADGETRGGLGLGLVITREIVELHGGSIKVESAGEGQGTTFTVRLPSSGQVDHSHQESDEAMVSPRLSGLHILLVEDASIIRDGLSTLLRNAGATVDAVTDAETALSAYRERRPAVLVSDLGLGGGIDGNQLMRRIRTEESDLRLPSVKAIAISAQGGITIERKAKESGYNAFIAKPIDGENLIRLLHKSIDA